MHNIREQENEEKKKEEESLLHPNAFPSPAASSLSLSLSLSPSLSLSQFASIEQRLLSSALFCFAIRLALMGPVRCLMLIPMSVSQLPRAEGVAAGRVIVTVTVMVAVAASAAAAADEDEVGIVGSLAALSRSSFLQPGRQFHKVSKQMTSVCGCCKGFSTAG